MEEKMKVVIVGGVAAGPKAGARINRLCPRAEVTLVEKGEFLSYAGCGLPYYVSGVVREQKELMCTPVGVVRDSVFFQDVKNIRVLNRTEALKVDRESRRVLVRRLTDNLEETLSYDRLVLATGSRPVIPPVEGIGKNNIFTLQNVGDAEAIKALLSERQARDVVIVGGGLIGIEMTEALTEKGCRVTVVEKLPQILPILDREIARLVERHLEARGVKIRVSATVEAFTGGEGVEAVKTDKGVFPCDMAILAVGVRPNAALAREAGLEIGPTGGIRVNEQMQTSDPAVFAVGDCTESRHLVTRAPCYVPLGSTANKHGRVAANTVCGREDAFPGVLGSAICKVFDYAVGRTGLGEEQAREAGFDTVTVLSPAPDKAHYYPSARPLMMKLVADRASRRLLGLQAVGPGAADKRIDVAATAISAGMTVEDVARLDLCYAPPYSPAMDNLITAADIARNKLDGLFASVSPGEVKAKIDRGDEFIFLDVRSPGEYEEVSIPGTVLVPLGALRERWKELPKDKEIVTFCKISLRGYEAALILQARGFKNVKVMDGGILMWPHEVTRKER